MSMKSRRMGLVILFAFVLAANSAAARTVSVDNTAVGVAVITVEIELCPEPADDPNTNEKEGLSKEDLERFVQTHEAKAEEYWNASNIKLRAKRGDPSKSFRFDFKFTILDNCENDRNPGKHRFNVHLGDIPPGQDFNANAGNLWQGNSSRTIAHELGHVMGLDEDYTKNGPTRDTIMGRGSSKKLTPYLLMTILFLHLDDPDKAESNKRKLMKTLLRMKNQELARRIAADNGINKAQYDAYKDQFTANGTSIQPDPPR